MHFWHALILRLYVVCIVLGLMLSALILRLYVVCIVLGLMLSALILRLYVVCIVLGLMLSALILRLSFTNTVTNVWCIPAYCDTQTFSCLGKLTNLLRNKIATKFILRLFSRSSQGDWHTGCVCVCVSGPLLEDHWEEWLPGSAVGPLYHPERWLPAAHTVSNVPA